MCVNILFMISIRDTYRNQNWLQTVCGVALQLEGMDYGGGHLLPLAQISHVHQQIFE